nr:replication factor A protein 1-like [Ipomoea batatas]
MAPMYILARDIHNRNTTAAMRLRLVRTYDIVQSRYRDKVRSRECIFHDEEGSYVHLNIPGNNVSVTNSFIEGHVYCIKNFLLINGRPSKLIDFVIEDLKGIQLKCTVWDQHVEKVMPFFQSDLTEPVIVLIQMCRVKVPENRTRCNKKVTVLKDGMYVCGKCGTHYHKPKLRYKIKIRVLDANGNAPFLLWDREALELLGGITAEELKAMQPKFPTKIPKEIESLVGRGMLFKINVQRDRLEKRNLAFPVMQIKEDIAVLNQYCPGLLKDTKQKGTDSVEPLDDDLDSDGAESPLPNALTQMAKGGGNESEAVKRRLLDEFSSTQCPKKKTHTAIIKLEKDSELGGDQN